MNAIVTRWEPGTQTQPSRYTATCKAGRVALEHDPRLTVRGNHLRVARALIKKLGWHTLEGERPVDWYVGTLPDRAGVVWVGNARGDAPVTCGDDTSEEER